MYSYHGVTLILFISTEELQYRRSMVPIRISRKSPPEVVVVINGPYVYIRKLNLE